MAFHPWAVRLLLTSQRKCLNQQRILRKSTLRALSARIRWGDTLRGIVRDDALEMLADQDAELVIDETGFLKQRKGSCGVGKSGPSRLMRRVTGTPPSTAHSKSLSWLAMSPGDNCEREVEQREVVLRLLGPADRDGAEPMEP
jgi:hypothetical protein